MSVVITTAAFEDRDGTVESFRPEDLVYGHEGTPRHADRVTQALSELKMEHVEQAVSLAVEAGIIDAAQGQEISDLWSAHVTLPSDR